jgi:hypothetical protein
MKLMARNFRQLQAKMDPASRADNERRVSEEIQRMALDELRRAKGPRRTGDVEK